MLSFNNGNGSNNSRSSGMSGNFNNRQGRENSGGRYNSGGPRDYNHNRRDRDGQRPYHSHVGGQSGDVTGADWNTPLPPNRALEQ